VGKAWSKYQINQCTGLTRASIFVEASPLINIKQCGWGAPTSNHFELPFLVHVWDVVGKTWLKSVINQTTSLSLASFFVNISPALIFLNVCPFNEKKKQMMTGSSYQ
jgi:hypothetical protein